MLGLNIIIIGIDDVIDVHDKWPLLLMLSIFMLVKKVKYKANKLI